MIINYLLPLKPPKRFETDSTSIVIGRNPLPDQHVDIDLVEDEYVSHQHARLSHENQEYWIEDLSSVNGTWVNGVGIAAKTRVGPSDKIQIGWTIIEILRDAVPEPATGPAPVPEFPTVTRHPEEPPDTPESSGQATDDLDLISDLMESLPSEPIRKPDASSKAKAERLHEQPVATLTPEPDQETPTIVLDLEKSSDAMAHFGHSEDLSDTDERFDESIASISEPESIPDSEGTIIDLTDVAMRPYAMSNKGTSQEMLTQSYRQLRAFNDLGRMLATADSLDALVLILVKHLQEAIPNAQRGAVLLPSKQGELLLKAHWPPGNHSVSMTWIKRAYERREPFIWSAPAENDTGSDTPESALFYEVKSAIYVPLLIGEEALGVMYVDNFFTREAFFATDLELMRAIANQVAMFVRDHVLRKDLLRGEKLRSHLARQFSPKIAQRIFTKEKHLRIGGERVNPVTILDSDVRGFTALSAKMEPDDVVRMLNEMFDAFVPIIFELDGVVDKYVGDSVLAIFGSPEKDDQQCEKAIQAAIEMQQAVHKLGEGRRVRRLPVFEVGIGIHTGEVIHGFIGSTERMEYTVIGDTVNRASRYCDGAGSGEILISKTVYERIYHLVHVQSKTIRTKHPEVEPDLEAFVVQGLKNNGLRSID